MQPRNLYVKTLFNIINDKKLSSEERNRRAAVSIKTIVSIKPFHDEFMQSNAGNVDLSEEVGLNLVDENGYTPLMHTAYVGYTEIVRLLLEAKVNPNMPDEKTGGTPLILAAQAGHTEIVRLLLEAKANPNMPDEKTGGTPLILLHRQAIPKLFDCY